MKDLRLGDDDRPEQSDVLRKILSSLLAALNLPLMLSSYGARYVAVPLTGLAALSGFVLGWIMISLFPFFFTGSVMLLIAAILVISVSTIVSIGGALVATLWLFSYIRRRDQADNKAYIIRKELHEMRQTALCHFYRNHCSDPR